MNLYSFENINGEMMSNEFEPIKSTKNIADIYKKYVVSTFHTDNEKYNDKIKDLIYNDYDLVKGPYLQISDGCKKSSSIRELTGNLLSKQFLKLNSDKLKPDMQLDASYNIIDKDRSAVVSTGAGSDKNLQRCFGGV